MSKVQRLRKKETLVVYLQTPPPPLKGTHCSVENDWILDKTLRPSPLWEKFPFFGDVERLTWSLRALSVVTTEVIHYWISVSNMPSLLPTSIAAEKSTETAMYSTQYLMWYFNVACPLPQLNLQGQGRNCVPAGLSFLQQTTFLSEC